MNPQNPTTSSTPAGATGSYRSTTESSDYSSSKPTVAQAARETVSQAKDTVRRTAARAKDETLNLASEKKSAAADRIDACSSAIHESARSLEEKDPNLAWFTHRAADRLQGAAEYMRSRSLSELRRDAEDVARRHPAVFFGGLFLAGLVFGNVVKASRRKLEDSDDNTAYEDEASDYSPPARQESESPQLSETARTAAGI